MASKKSHKTVNHNNPLESFKSIGQGVSESLVKDLGINGGQDFLQFLGMDITPSDKKAEHAASGEHASEVDIINFKKKQEHAEKAKKAESRAEAAIDYHRDILKSRERSSHQESREMTDQVQQIINELKSLINSSQELKAQFGEIAMEKTSTNVGTYHTNFFEWMIHMIRQAKEKVEDSQSWLNAVKGKSGKKGYWGMFKKHGTSFALSNERQVATQVG